MKIASQMKRTSYLAELEFLYIFALRCPEMRCGIGSLIFIAILNYIDLFFESSDVNEDLKPYLMLLNSREDVPLVRSKFMESANAEDLDGDTEFQSHLYRSVEEEYHKNVVPLTKLRWKFAQHKISRTLGIYTNMPIE